MAIPTMPQGPIGTIPQGLLGLLQLKETGRNPAQLLDAVQPNLDITPLYLQRNLQGTLGLWGDSIQTPALVNGQHGFQNLVKSTNSANCVTPPNEMWLIYQWSLDIQTQAAGDSITACPAILGTAGGVGSRAVAVAPMFADVVTARARGWLSNPITVQFFAPPSTQFGVYITDINTVGGISIFSEMRAVRIPI